MWKNYFAVGYKSVKNKKIFKKRKRKMASFLPLKTVPWEKKKKSFKSRNSIKRAISVDENILESGGGTGVVVYKVDSSAPAVLRNPSEYNNVRWVILII